MLSPKHYYVDVEILNTGNESIPCEYEYRFENDFIAGPSLNYNVSVCKADYNLSNMPTYVNKRDIEFEVINDDKSFYKPCTFKSKDYFNVPDIITDINLQIIDAGKFSIDTESNKICYECINPALHIRFHESLQKLFDGFKYTRDMSVWVLDERNVGTVVKQSFNTMERFFNAKSVNINSSGLSQQPYNHISNIKNYYTTTILSDQVVNGSDNLRSRLIYQPTILRRISMVGNTTIRTITIRCSIIYSNGAERLITISPENHFSCLLLFERI